MVSVRLESWLISCCCADVIFAVLLLDEWLLTGDLCVPRGLSSTQHYSQQRYYLPSLHHWRVTDDYDELPLAIVLVCDKICMMMTRLACNRAIESSYWRMDNDSDVGLLMGYVLYRLPIELESMDLDTFPR